MVFCDLRVQGKMRVGDTGTRGSCQPAQEIFLHWELYGMHLNSGKYHLWGL